MIRCLSIGFILLVSLTACDKDTLVTEKWTWKKHQWISADHKSITLEATDTTAVYRMDIELTHDDTYKFQNLYVRTLTTFPSGKEVSSVTSLELANADGSWSGDCGGSTCRIELPLQKRFTFPEIGTYSWTIEPYMRMDTVKGIINLKVSCSRVEE